MARNMKTIPEIARELSVATILEGGVQRSGKQVRINVQLIDARTDQHLWAEIYDRELTAENLFAIQSEISTVFMICRLLTWMPTTTICAHVSSWLHGAEKTSSWL